MSEVSREQVWLRFAASIAGSTRADISSSLATQIGKEADRMVREWEERFPQSEPMKSTREKQA